MPFLRLEASLIKTTHSHGIHLSRQNRMNVLVIHSHFAAPLLRPSRPSHPRLLRIHKATLITHVLGQTAKNPWNLLCVGGLLLALAHQLPKSTRVRLHLQLKLVFLLLPSDHILPSNQLRLETLLLPCSPLRLLQFSHLGHAVLLHALHRGLPLPLLPLQIIRLVKAGRLLHLLSERQHRLHVCVLGRSRLVSITLARRVGCLLD